MAILKTINSSASMLFGIVTYKERYWECASFCSLIKSYLQSEIKEVLSIYIFDNTDIDGWNLEPRSFGGNIKVEYVNFKNPGISAAYNAINNFAFTNSYNWVIYFDQDTILPIETYTSYFKKQNENNLNYPIKAPIIYSNGVILSPCIYKNYRSYSISNVSHTLLPIISHSCFNSGLMIHSQFFIKVGGYNENLKLDFCDHDFIENAKKHFIHFELLDLKLEQNFSGFTHNKEQSIIRYQIFCNDIKQFYKKRNRIKILIFVDLPHLLKLTYIYKSIIFFKIRVLHLFS